VGGRAEFQNLDLHRSLLWGVEMGGTAVARDSSWARILVY